VRRRSAAAGELLKPGNIGLARLLLAVYAAGDEGITTVKLLRQLNSITHGQAFLSRAAREGLIKRKRVPKPTGQKGNYFTVNRITKQGKQLVLSQFFSVRG
jgi:hypothetical protein